MLYILLTLQSVMIQSSLIINPIYNLPRITYKYVLLAVFYLKKFALVDETHSYK